MTGIVLNGTVMTIFEDFVPLLAKIVAVDVDWSQVTEETSLVFDLMIDSIAMVSMVVLCEETFQVDLADAVADLDTIGDALRVIEQARNQAGTAKKAA